MDLSQLRSILGDRYDIERELGRGGMGAVFLARDRKLNRSVALKVLPAEMGGNGALRDRFLRETRTAASFSHPNIVPVYSIEEGEGLLAYAMAYIEGESLADRVKRAGPLTIRETVKLLQDTGYALAYAHGRGVVHRDIKPDNIMLERASGRAMLMDFGIARAISAAPTSATQNLTRIGEVVGTPEYMSPEQATGDEVDGRSDLYSLGLTAWFALTGRPAITGDTTGKVLARQITEPVAPIQSVRAEVPQALAAAIDRCVMKDPAERFQTGEELVDTIDAAKLSGPEIPLPIRLVQQDLSSFSMVILFGAVVVYFLTAIMSREGADGDVIFPIIILITILLTRMTQTMREVGRIAGSGFTAADINKGLRAVLAERDVRRQELYADTATRRARRRTLIAAVAQFAIAAALFWWAMQFRFQVGPGKYNIAPAGGIMVLASTILFGVSLALIVRSPFRQPIGERLFRLVWLGPIGKAFVHLSGRTAWKAQASAPARPATIPPSRATLPPAARPAVAPDRIEALEQRVSELERWRKQAR